MIGFVTWPLFVPSIIYKGDKGTKPNIVVKIPCEQLYIILTLLDMQVFGRL